MGDNKLILRTSHTRELCEFAFNKPPNCDCTTNAQGIDFATLHQSMMIDLLISWRQLIKITATNTANKLGK